MYKLLKLGGAPFRKYPQLSLFNLSENANLSVTEKTCILCKQLNIHSKITIRGNSSVTNLNVSKTKNKTRKKKLSKLFSDILVVTETSSKQQKANIRKLSSKELNVLASSSLSLNELYKLKELTSKPILSDGHTYSNLTVIEDFPTTSPDNYFSEFNTTLESPVISVDFCSTNSAKVSETDLSQDSIINQLSEDIDVPDAVHIDGDLELESLPVINSLQPEVLDEHHETEPEDQKMIKKNPVREAMEKKYREDIATRILAAYAEVGCFLKNPQRGLNALYFHRSRTNHGTDKYYSSVRNVNIYNTLLKGFAQRADYDKIKEVLAIMAEDGIEKNEQTYGAIFHCLGRINVNNNYVKDIRIFSKDALQHKITYDMIMNKATFCMNERDIVLRALHVYDPNYVPKYNKPQVMYNNHLVNHLNHEEQLKPTEKKSGRKGGIFTHNKLKEMVGKQLHMEEAGYVTVKSIESKATPTEDILNFRKNLDKHYKMWEDTAVAAFSRDLSALVALKGCLNMESYMKCIPVEDFITILLDEAKRLAQGSETYSPTVPKLHRDLGSKVYARYKILRKKRNGVVDKVLDIHHKYCEHYASAHGTLGVLPEGKVYRNPRHQWQWAEHSVCHMGATLTVDHQEWAPTTLQAIGKFLYHIIMHDLKVDSNAMRNNKYPNMVPAFYTIFRNQGRSVKEEVKPHPILSKLYRASMPETLTFPTYELPMLCPPLPWISTQVGGYLISPCDFIRLPPQAQAQKQRLQEAHPTQLYPSFDALNQLSSVPWKVNQNVLDVILEVFKSGGSSKLDVPEPPSSLSPPQPPSLDMDKAQKYQFFRQKLQHRRKKSEMYSLWCDCLYRLSLADHFRDEIFWLPHNMDFRGRVYPVPPHLNHLGSDLARSMLVFAESRPLGPHGLDWLKIHLINLTGLKKRDPISERLKFANEIIDLILDSADNPLTGKRWWAESDEPWQTLACCMEVANVVRSPDPTAYHSHFPIHQDGSCNGLQHYAALGRDSAGAYSVNLTPSEIPQDVYSAVVTLVEEQRAKDAETGIEVAKILDGFIKRKVIKQTIMTTVYGVTRFGARLQIARQLKDIDDFPKESVWAASSYLTGRTFESLRTMFTSTREIQDWFTECARLISAVTGQHVEWVTPLGLPIVQPYFKFRKLPMGSSYESFAMDQYEKPNVMKQKNAFPPNFIHSLDSSHMMLTSLHCERAGVTFVSVHDCYWTHPSTVHIMNKICREQFVALHSEAILENLSVFLSEKYSYQTRDFCDDGSVTDLTKKKLNRILRQLPKTGDFDIKQVLDSVYFFS